MEYRKTPGGEYQPLTQKNVDTGMGVERTVAMIAGCDTVYDIGVLKTLTKRYGKWREPMVPHPDPKG